MIGSRAAATAQQSALVVLGTSGHAREVIAIAEATAGPAVLGCLGPYRQPDISRLPARWLGTDDWLATAPPEVTYLIGIGAGRVRARIDEALRAQGRDPALLVHPAAVLGSGVELSDGCVLWPGAALTRDVTAGRHVHISTNVSVGHDTVLEDYATLLPGCTVAGSSRIGYAATVGAGATVIDGVHVGAGAMVGAGAAVVRDVPAGAVVVGVPARPLPRRDGQQPAEPAGSGAAQRPGGGSGRTGRNGSPDAVPELAAALPGAPEQPGAAHSHLSGRARPGRAPNRPPEQPGHEPGKDTAWRR